MPTPTPATPLVVLVPGLGLDARSLAAVRERLGDPGLVVPLPALGVSVRRGSDLRVERQAGRLLDALPEGRTVVLVGHSASCPVVVEAATRSEAVVGLVLVCPVTDPGAVSWPRIAVRWLRTARHEHLWQVPVLVPQYLSTGLVGLLRGMDVLRHYRTDEGLSGVTVPLAVIRGEHDLISPEPWCTRLAATARAVVTTVPEGAHMLPLTHPQVVADAAERLRAGTGNDHVPGTDGAAA